MLEFPDNIGELVGEGSIVVSVQMKGGGRVRFQEKRLELYPLDLKMKDAEDFCVSRGGHLASIGSQEDLDEIAEVAGGEFVWLGGTRIAMIGTGWMADLGAMKVGTRNHTLEKCQILTRISHYVLPNLTKTLVWVGG